VRAFTDRWGVPCREYVQHVFIGEETVEASGTVCRAADGSWTLRR
jgi:surface antigen